MADRANTRPKIAVLLQVRVGRCGGYCVDAVLRTILGAGHGARGDQVPWQVMTAQATMFLQLLRSSGERLPIHDGLEGMPQLRPVIPGRGTRVPRE